MYIFYKRKNQEKFPGKKISLDLGFVQIIIFQSNFLNFSSDFFIPLVYVKKKNVALITNFWPFAESKIPYQVLK